MRLTDILKLEVGSYAPYNLISVPSPVNSEEELDGWNAGGGINAVNTASGLQWGFARNGQPGIKDDLVQALEGDRVVAGYRLNVDSQVTAGTYTFHVAVRFVDLEGNEVSVVSGEDLTVSSTADLGIHELLVDATAPEGSYHAQLYLAEPTGSGLYDAYVEYVWATRGPEIALLDLDNSPSTQVDRSTIKWHNILGDANSIKVTREELDVGTLAATLLSETYDPFKTLVVRKGNQVRLTALVEGAYEAVYTGRITNAEVEYNAKVEGTQFPALVSTNLFPDPSFEYGKGIWPATSSTVTHYTNEAEVRTGEQCIATGLFFGGTVPEDSATMTGLEPGKTYTWSIWSFNPSTNLGTRGTWIQASGPGVQSTQTSTADTTKDGWVQHSVIFTTKTSGGSVIFTLFSDDGAEDVILWDDACVVEGSEVGEDFFGGTVPTGRHWYQWEGEEGNSPSEKWTWTQMGPKGTKVTIMASDYIATLANEKQPYGYPTFTSTTVVSYNPDASSLDQIALTRDTVRGYAWVDRLNELQVRNPDEMSDLTVMGLGPDLYSEVHASFDIERAINSVTVKWLRYDTISGAVEEVSYGPYTNPASVQEWGEQHVEFTIHGEQEDEFLIRQYAEHVLASTSSPVPKVNRLTFPIKSEEALNQGLPILDLYDLVAVPNDVSRTVNRVRVVRIEHDITPDKGWLMSLAFGDDGAAATPRSQPSVSVPGNEQDAVNTEGGATTRLVATNYMLNPSFGGGITDWTSNLDDPLGFRLSLSNQGYEGNSALRSPAVAPHYTNHPIGSISDLHVDSPLTSFGGSFSTRVFKARVQVGYDPASQHRTPRFTLKARWYDSGGNFISETVGPKVAVVGTGWASLSLKATKPANASKAKIRITHDAWSEAWSSKGYLTEFLVDTVFLSDGDYTGDYFDGGVRPNGYSSQWSGTANNSTSSLYGTVLVQLSQPAPNITGMIQPWAGDDAPDGWLLCDGSEYLKGEYPELFAIVGTKFGTGTTTDYFRVPNFQNRFPLGAGDRNVGDTGGSETHTLTVSEMPAHRHSINHDHSDVSGGGHQHDKSWRENASGLGAQNNIAAAGGTAGNVVDKAATYTDGQHTHNVPAHTGNSGSEGSGDAFDIMPPYQVLNYVIKF